MKNLSILFFLMVFHNALIAQLRTISVDLSNPKIKTNKEYVLADKNNAHLYITLQDGDNINTSSSMSLLKIDTSGKIINSKALHSEFPKLNRLLLDMEDSLNFYQFYRLNSADKGYQLKTKGVQVVKSMCFNKMTLEQTEKTLFTVNYPTEEFLITLKKDNDVYLLTYEKKSQKLNIYAFDAEKLQVKKTFSLPQNGVKKFYDKVFDNISEGKDFTNSANMSKIFLDEKTLHFVFDYNETQYYMPVDLSKDTLTIKEIYLPLKSVVALSSNPKRESTGVFRDNKLFQLRLIDNVLCFGVYNVVSKERIKTATYEYKKGEMSTPKNSPYYLDNVEIDKKDDLTNQGKFFNELSSMLIGLEVTEKDNFYELKLGGVNVTRFSRLDGFDDFHTRFMMQQQDRGLQNAIKYAPPPIRTGGFRSIPNFKSFVFEEELTNEAFFYLKLNKLDFSIAEGKIAAPNSSSEKEFTKVLKKLSLEEKKITPIFKMKDKKGFGYYDENTKKYILKIAE
jgi:hypothetical protein